MEKEPDWKESLQNTIIFDPGDWGKRKRSAWIYGIIVGWDQDSLRELALRHKWDTAELARLQQLHLDFLNS